MSYEARKPTWHGRIYHFLFEQPYAEAGTEHGLVDVEYIDGEVVDGTLPGAVNVAYMPSYGRSKFGELWMTWDWMITHGSPLRVFAEWFENTRTNRVMGVFYHAIFETPNGPDDWTLVGWYNDVMQARYATARAPRRG